MSSRLIKLIVCCIPFILLAFDPPTGMQPQAWTLFPFYIAAILGIMLSPLPSAAIVLCVLAAYSIFFKGPAVALSGFSSKTTWLVFGAFLIGQAFIETGLGRRIAYHLIGKFGHSSLGLGYAAAITDLAVCPATPSNTARTGGIVWPIFRSLAQTLGSTPTQEPRKIGSYFALTLYQISLCSGIVFMTGLASNMLVLEFTNEVLGIEVNWFEWFSYFSVPGLVCLALAPYVVYKLYPPEIKTIDNKPISKKGLQELGPMKPAEKRLLLFFIMAILGWSTSGITGIASTSVALGFVGLCLLFSVMDWSNVAGQKSAWSTLIWYGGILSLAGGLNKFGFFSWLGDFMGTVVPADMNPMFLMAGLLIISVLSRYLFASSAAYVASILPVLYSIGVAAGIPSMMLFLLLGASSAFGSLLTHYSNACGPVLFGAGYVPQKIWWSVGTVFCLIIMIVYGVIGIPYWMLMGWI